MALILETQESHDNLGSNSISSIDLNADIGEHDGDGFSADSAILAVVTSANIACGEHAGSPEVMRQTVINARDLGVSIGAHPGYPDREGFGRRELSFSIDQIAESFETQIERLRDSCNAEGVRLRHVKPHGALYNRAVRDSELAERLAVSIRKIDPSLIMLGLDGSFLETASLAIGLLCAREAFIDRGYMPDRTLVPRSSEGALIDDPQAAAVRAVRMVSEHIVIAIDGTSIHVHPDSLCVHGDGAHALETVSAARRALENAGHTIEAFAK